MAEGILGVIACPMLEDELIYALGKDEGPKTVTVLDTEYCGSLRRKLEAAGIGYGTMPYDAFLEDGLEREDGRFDVVINMNDLGLHAEPKDLKVFIEEQVEAFQPHIDVLGIYYGLCGNHGWDLTRWCEERGFKPAFIFRDGDGRICDDCIGVCVGGGPRYLELEKTYVGMLYATPAIASNWRDFLACGDFAKGLESMNRIESLREFGVKTIDDYLRWILEMCEYKYIVQLDNGLGDREDFDRYVEEMSSSLNLGILQAEPGWTTLQPAEDLYRACKRYLGN